MADVLEFAEVSLGPGTLYGAIMRLEERGLVRPVKADDRRQPYRIITAGRQYFRDELASLDLVIRAGQLRLGKA